MDAVWWLSDNRNFSISPMINNNGSRPDGRRKTFQMRCPPDCLAVLWWCNRVWNVIKFRYSAAVVASRSSLVVLVVFFWIHVPHTHQSSWICGRWLLLLVVVVCVWWGMKFLDIPVSEFYKFPIFSLFSVLISSCYLFWVLKNKQKEQIPVGFEDDDYSRIIGNQSVWSHFTTLILIIHYFKVR